MQIKDQIKNALKALEAGELSGKAAHIAGLLKASQEENHNQKLMLQRSLKIITQPSTEEDCKQEEQLYEAHLDLNFMWKWIERGKFDKNHCTAEGAIDILAHYPGAPWNKCRENWNTSHKEYDADITAFIESKK